MERLSRFVALYEQTLGRLKRRLEYVDLRYPNGFALRVPEIVDSGTQPPGAKTKRGGRGGGMSREQGPRFAGMRPTAIAAGRRRRLPTSCGKGTEAAA